MNFTQFGLDARLLAGVEAAGYTTPTPIQQQAIPVVLQGSDVLGLAQTGTGKTAAFVLPILQRLLNGAQRKPRVLIVTPTRELAEQTHTAIRDLGQKTKVRSLPIYGGVGKSAQVTELRRGAEIIVACPGRLLDHLQDGAIDLSGIEVLVLDEADRMCDMGFLPDVRRILRHLPKQRQTLFFSATMPSDIRQLANEILTAPVTVQVDIIAPAKTVSHALYPIPEGLKNRLLFTMLEQTATGRVVIFTRTKRRARNLALDLEQRKYRVAMLQGNMAQNRRQEAITGFRAGKYDILVATDIAARGIDVSEITHVINFDMPDTVDAYTHRIGRTGRAEQNGDAFTFVTPADELIVKDIEKVLGKKIERRKQEGFDYAGYSPTQRTSEREATAALKEQRAAQQREREAYWASRRQPGSRPATTTAPAAPANITVAPVAAAAANRQSRPAANQTRYAAQGTERAPSNGRPQNGSRTNGSHTNGSQRNGPPRSEQAQRNEPAAVRERQPQSQRTMTAAPTSEASSPAAEALARAMAARRRRRLRQA